MSFRISQTFYRNINANSPELPNTSFRNKNFVAAKKIKPRAKNILQCGYLKINKLKHVYVIYFFITVTCSETTASKALF